MLTTIALLMAAGCAELPLDNAPPDPPLLVSDGVLEPGFGVAVDVVCHDPDGDRVTIQFLARAGAVEQPFVWTSFIQSDVAETFYLPLAPGEWVLEAVARDELDETGDPAAITLSVVLD
ncbi:hypothetical protein GF314_05845 [bacterium]|nr:hypothetical protein [bacterium]